MSDYKPYIVADVRRSVEAMNDIVLLLQSDVPLITDILDINYSQTTVDDFHKSSEAVVHNLESAAELAATWFRENGDRQSRNLDEAGRVGRSVRGTSSKLREADEHIKAIEARIGVLESDIQNEEANLSSAQRALSNAREELDRRERTGNIIHAVTMATFLFFPIISFAAAGINMATMHSSCQDLMNAISTIESQLSSSHDQLQSQRETLREERDEKNRLSSRVSELRRQANSLSAEARQLESARGDSAELSKRINDCLHTVNAALSSSKIISTMSAMRNVVTGIRGVVHALGADSMFEGPLAELNDAALAALDRRVAAIRTLRLTI